MGGEADEPAGRRVGSVAIITCCLLAVFLLASGIPALSVPVDYLDFNDTNATIGAGPDSGDPVVNATGNGSERPRIGVESGSNGSAPAAGPVERFEAGMDNGTAAETVHFTVASEEPAYWRVTAYDRYLGDGWRQSGRPPFQESFPQDRSRRVLSQEITLRIPADVLPVAWRPVEVTADSATGNGSSVTLNETAQPGESYTVTSLRPTRDPTVLEDAESAYPKPVEERYTALPGSVPKRVFDRTDSITRGNDSRYETAVAVEQWLRSNYDYRRNRSSFENDTAETVLFDRERAHSSALATTMTVMLRGEGIPARYVKGYSPGVPNETTDRYVVRGVHQHAWVEVYFPEVGWVPFDPTPAEDRGARIRAGADTEPGLEYLDHGNRTMGSNESDTGSASQADADGNTGAESDESTNQGSDPGEEDRGSRTPEDGGSVESDSEGTSAGSEGADQEAAERSGESETGEGAEGESQTSGSGETDSPGSTFGSPSNSPPSVPSFQQSASDGNFELRLVDDPVPGRPLRVRVLAGGEPVQGVEVRFDGESVGETNETGNVTGGVPYEETLNVTAYGGGEAVASRNVSLPTTIDIAIEDPVYAGEEVSINATIEGHPVARGDVRVDGRLSDRTNRSGLGSARLPDTTGNATISVARGAAFGEQAVDLPSISIGVDARPAPLPGRPLTVAVAYEDGTPVVGAPVFMDDERVARTDDSGTATISADATYTSTVAVARGDWRSTTTVHPMRNLLVGIGIVLVASLLVGAAARLLGLAPLWFLRSIPVAVVTKSLVGLILLSRAVDSVWSAITRALGAPASLRGLVPAVARLIAAIRARIERVCASLVDSIGSSSDRTDSGAAATTREEYGPVRRAWSHLVAIVPVTRPERKTPREIANRAIDAGVPADAVETILNAFRALEYGNRAPDQSRREAVRDALEHVNTDEE